MLSTLIVQATVAIPAAIIGEAVLSFLGLGVQPPTPSWGVMLADAQSYLSQAPRLAVYPGHRDLPLLAVVQPARRRAARRFRSADDAMSLLEVEGLSVRFDTDDGPVHAVDRLSFTLGDGEVLGVVGESGCGKSVSFMSLLRLLPETAVGRRHRALRRRRPARSLERAAAGDPRPPDRVRLPGADDLAQPGLQGRQSDRRGAAPPSRRCRAPTRGAGRSSCSTSCASRRPSAVSTSTRTSSRVGCGSA